MPGQIRLHCLGTPTVYLPDGSVLRLRVRKHLALLVFLAMEPRAHRRDRLAELLWPGVSAREGRHSLATALSVLRARLGRFAIEAGRDNVRLVTGSVELDLDRLALGDVLGSDTEPPLAVAPLLEDFDIADAPDWGQWRDGQAARWQPAIRDALLALIDRSRRHGDTRSMERLADSLLAIDALSEEGIRSKMEARAFAGDRLSALRLFEEWKDRLAEEVGAQPGDLVEGMAVRLRRRGWERSSQSHIAPVHTDQWKGRPFVGRAREYRSLYEGWEGCQRGTPRHVILTGDSGVGKSTLAERLATAAGLQGAVSAREQCHEVERDVPYAAMGRLAVGLLDRPGATAIAPEWLGELGRAVSEVKRRFPHAPPPLEAEGETVRVRIADAFAELAIAVAEEQPLILVVDDLHLADDASVAVLHHLLRRIEQRRILVLLTARPGEIASGGNAQRLLERSEQVGLSTVGVTPLGAEEAEELLESLVTARAAGSPAPAVRRALLQAAAGYPMVLELLVDDWQMHADQCLALTLGGMTERAAEQNPGEMYARLLDRLSGALEPTSRNVLNLASVLGSRLNDFSLYGLVDLTLAETMAGLSRLTAMRILRDVGEGLEFINELMRAQAYITVPSSVRRVLHSKVADVLIGRVEGGEGMLRLEIAWHCVRARRKEESARYLIAGADEAIEQGAHVDAERALMTAIPNLPADVQADAQYRLALVWQDQGRWEEARVRAAQDAAGLPHSRRQVFEDLATISGLVARSIASGVLPDECEQVLAIVRGPATGDLRTRALAALATYVDKTHDYATAELALIEAHALLRSHGHTRVAASLHVTIAHLSASLRAYSDTTEHLGIASQLLPPSARMSPLSLRIEMGYGTTECANGRFEAAVPRLVAAQSIAKHLGNERAEINAVTNLALCKKRLGEYRAALELARRSLLLCRGTRGFYDAVAARYHEAFSLAMLGHPPSLAESFDTATVLDGEPRNWLNQCRGLWAADIAWLNGQQPRALEAAQVALSIGDGRPLALGLVGLVCRWSAVCASCGRDAGETQVVLQTAITNAASYDATDRVEILFANRLYADISRRPHERPNDQQLSWIRGLPVATITQLRRLGLPADNEGFQ